MTATIRKFIKTNPIRVTTPYSKQLRAHQIQYHRLGNTLTGIGEGLASMQNMMQFQLDFLKDSFVEETTHIEEEKEKKLEIGDVLVDEEEKQENLEADKEAEKQQEALGNAEEEGEEQAKKVPKRRLGFLEGFAKSLSPVFGFLKKVVGLVVGVGFFKWLGDPANVKKIQSLLRFFKAIFTFTTGLIGMGLNGILTGIGNIFGSKDPGQSNLSKAFEGLFGVFKILGGIASLWLASRVLFPWKLIGDVKMMQTLGTALTAAEAQGGPGTRLKKPRLRKFKNIGDRVRNMRRRMQVRGGRTLQNVKSFASKTMRRLRPTNIKRFANVGMEKLKRFGKNTASTFKNQVDDLGKNVAGMWQKTKNIGSMIKTKAGKGFNFAKDMTQKQLKRLSNWQDDFVKNMGKNWEKMKEFGKGVAKKIGDIAELAKDPKKLVEMVKGNLKGKINQLVKKDKTIKKLVDLAKNPKKIKDGIRGMLKSAKKSKGLLKLRKGLQMAKKSTKGIGGIDKLIAALMGVLDYTVFGEAPVNAILRALGGLTGYTAGFSIGAPFGGFPGFVTGMAGGALGELAGDGLSAMIASVIPKKLNKDPIMNDGRPLARNPFKKDQPVEVEESSEKISTKSRVTGSFDLDTGTGYINGMEVSAKEYEAFVNMSEQEKLAKYGKTQMSKGGVVPMFSKGGQIPQPMPELKMGGNTLNIKNEQVNVIANSTPRAKAKNRNSILIVNQRVIVPKSVPSAPPEVQYTKTTPMITD